MVVYGLNDMTLIVVMILGIAGLVALLQAINHVTRCSYYGRGNLLLIDIVVAVMYLLVAAIVGLFEIYSGYNPMVIYAALALGVVVMTAFFVKIYFDHPRSTNRRAQLLFLGYFCLVAYLTIFMRIGSVDTSVVTTPFDDLRDAFIRRDPAMMQHFLLNVAMFIPFGYLVPATNPRYLRKWSFAMMGGLIASTVIETTQMFFQLGQSDVDDIIANTLGAVIGYVLIRFVWQVRKNWSF